MFILFLNASSDDVFSSNAEIAHDIFKNSSFSNNFINSFADSSEPQKEPDLKSHLDSFKDIKPKNIEENFLNKHIDNIDSISILKSANQENFFYKDLFLNIFLNFSSNKKDVFLNFMQSNMNKPLDFLKINIDMMLLENITNEISNLQIKPYNDSKNFYKLLYDFNIQLLNGSIKMHICRSFNSKTLFPPLCGVNLLNTFLIGNGEAFLYTALKDNNIEYIKNLSFFNEILNNHRENIFLENRSINIGVLLNDQDSNIVIFYNLEHKLGLILSIYHQYLKIYGVIVNSKTQVYFKLNLELLQVIQLYISNVNKIFKFYIFLNLLSFLDFYKFNEIKKICNWMRVLIGFIKNKISLILVLYFSAMIHVLLILNSHMPELKLWINFHKDILKDLNKKLKEYNYNML
jgi:hypothetical protein